MVKSKPYYLITAIILYLISRLLYIFFLNEADLVTNLKLIESQYIGLVAKHIQEGLIMPLWDYQYSSYDGGTLIAGILLVPLFLVFGQNSFAHTSLGLLANLFAFVLWLRFLNTYYSKRMRNLFALLFILSPPLYTKATLVVGGNHLEIDIFCIIVISLFYQLFYNQHNAVNPTPKATTRNFIALGFFAGIGVYYCYSLGVILLTLFLYWCTLDKKSYPKKNYGYLFVFFLLGISCIFPRLTIFNSMIKTDIVDQWSFSNLVDFPAGFIGATFYQLPKMVGLGSPLHYGLYFIFILSMAAYMIMNGRSLWQQIKAVVPFRKSKIPLSESNNGNFFAFFILIFMVIYASSGFNLYLATESPLRHRYLFLLFPFIFFITAWGIDQLYNKSHPSGKLVANILIGYIIVVGIMASATQLNFNGYQQKFDRRFSRRGYSHEMLGTVICSRYCGEPKKAVELLNNVNQPHILETYRGFGFEFAEGDHQNIEYYQFLMTNKDHQREFLKGVAIGKTSVENFQDTDLERAYLNEVMSYGACQDPEDLARRLMYYVDDITFEDKSRYYQGIGKVLALQCDLREDTRFQMTNQIEPKYQSSFYVGVSEGIQNNTDILTVD